MSLKLSQGEKEELERRHKSERDGRIKDRIKAVLLSDEGWPQKYIAQALRLSEQTICQQLEEYRSEQKLKPENGGSKSKLSAEESEELDKHLAEETYTSAKEIIKHVIERYGVTYSEQGMHNWLEAHGFSYKKPKGVPLKADTNAQEEFKKKYNELKAKLGMGEVILFMDSVHPTQATKITYGWIKKGVDKAIATVASRDRMNISGAINLEDMSIITSAYDSISGKSTINFLEKIEEKYPEATVIHVVLDNGGAHKSEEIAARYLQEPNAINKIYLRERYGIDLPRHSAKVTKAMKKQLKVVLETEPEIFINLDILSASKLTVKDFLSSLIPRPPEKISRIKLHYIPAYSPNLNPIERAWKVMNEHVRNNKVFTSFKDFQEKITEFFSYTWNDIKESLFIRINDKFETLKPIILQSG